MMAAAQSDDSLPSQDAGGGGGGRGRALPTQTSDSATVAVAADTRNLLADNTETLMGGVTPAPLLAVRGGGAAALELASKLDSLLEAAGRSAAAAEEAAAEAAAARRRAEAAEAEQIKLRGELRAVREAIGELVAVRTDLAGAASARDDALALKARDAAARDARVWKWRAFGAVIAAVATAVAASVAIAVLVMQM
ncbi:hypothetical protein FNF31_02998 [Cafeteria roenbergensis]|nr:hypothetical protein FNF31_02998 [Cafeteria roenbergensis]